MEVRPQDVSVFFPTQPVDVNDVAAFADLTRLRGMRRFYLGQSHQLDTHAVFARLTGRGPTPAFGTGVVLTGLRHPLAAAVAARTTAALSGQPFVAGFGLGPRRLAEATGGWPSSPLTAVREYATIVRALLDGERVDVRGETVSFTGGVRNAVTAPPVELGLGVLRPRMAEVAGEVADVAISWLTPARYCQDVLLPALDRGAKDRVTRPRLATVVPVAVERPGRDLFKVVHAGFQHHLAAPHYGEALARAGLDVRPGDARHNAAEVVRSGLLVSGTPAEIVDRLREHRAAGIDEIVLHPGGVAATDGPVAALQDLDDIADALEDRRPGEEG